MKIAKKLCPLCHYIMKVGNVKTVDNVKVRKYYCKHCGWTIRTYQKPNDIEYICEEWKTGHYRDKLEDKVRIFSNGQYEVIKADGTYECIKIKEV